jgi:hypothetical protein
MRNTWIGWHVWPFNQDFQISLKKNLTRTYETNSRLVNKNSESCRSDVCRKSWQDYNNKIIQVLSIRVRGALFSDWRLARSSIYSLSYNPSFPSMKYLPPVFLPISGFAHRGTRAHSRRKTSSEPWPSPVFFTSSDTYRGARQSCRADLRFMPSPSSSPRAPGDQTLRRIFAPSKRIFKIRSTTLFWSAVRGQRENQSFILCNANTCGLHFSASVREYSHEQTVWFSKRSVIK